MAVEAGVAAFLSRAIERLRTSIVFEAIVLTVGIRSFQAARKYERQVEINAHHCGALLYNEAVATKRRSPVKRTPSSVRQSVTIPAQLAMEVRRLAKERKVTVSRALVTLAEKGVEAEAAERARLAEAYEQFLAADGSKKNHAGKDLIQAIFGREAIAEGPLR